MTTGSGHFGLIRTAFVVLRSLVGAMTTRTLIHWSTHMHKPARDGRLQQTSGPAANPGESLKTTPHARPTPNLTGRHAALAPEHSFPNEYGLFRRIANRTAQTR